MKGKKTNRQKNKNIETCGRFMSVDLARSLISLIALRRPSLLRLKVKKANYSKRPKSGHFGLPISEDNYRPKLVQKCPDFGHSTKHGCFRYKKKIINKMVQLSVQLG